MNALPKNVIYNGPMNACGQTLLLFTDMATKGTFTVEPSRADNAGILAALTTHRRPLLDRASNFDDQPEAGPMPMWKRYALAFGLAVVATVVVWGLYLGFCWVTR